MSLITLLGGVEANQAVVLEQKLNDISENLGKLAESIIQVNQRLDVINWETTEHQNQLSDIYSGMTSLKECFTEQENAYRQIAREWNGGECRDISARIAEIEKLQRYFMSSHGKVLNDVRDLKKEIHGIYERLPRPSEEELRKSSAPDPAPKKNELLEMAKELDIDCSAKGALIRALNYNRLETFDDIRDRTFDDLCEMKFIKPTIAKIISELRDKHFGVSDPEPVVKKDIPDYSIRAVMKDERNISQKQRSAVINTLYKYGVNTLRDLAKLNYRDIESIPRIGKTSMEAIRNVYKEYIWVK